MKCSPLRWLCVWHISLLCWAAVRVNNAPVNIVLTLTPVTQPVTYQAPSYWQAPGSPPVMGDPPTHTEMVPTGQTTLSAQYGGDDPIPEFVLNVFAPTVTQGALGELTGLGLAKFLKCVPKLARAAITPADGTAPNLLYHYTTAPESSFANGLWENSSVTDKLYTDATQASQELGIPVPDKVIPIQNTGQFVPNT